MATINTVNNPIFWRLKDGERRVILVIGDLIAAFLAMIIALLLWGNRDWFNFSTEFLQYRPPVWYYSLPILWVLLLIELYDIRRASRRKETIIGIAVAGAISTVFYLFIYFSSPPNSLPRFSVAIYIICSSLITLVWRLLYIKIFNAPRFMRRVLIVGAGRSGSTLAKVVRDIKPPPFILVGYVDDDPRKVGRSISEAPVIGKCSELIRISEKENISNIILAISGTMEPESFQEIFFAEERGIEVTTMPIMYEELLGRVPITLLEADWVLRSFVDYAHASQFYELVKRFIDVCGSLIGLIILIILFPLISVTIFLDTGFPLFYTQNRLGKNGRMYRILKFRTMKQDAEKDGKARPAEKNDERITRVGNVLRKSHLDEFPQFLNILNGDMSIVGPRAERLELVEQLQNNVPFYRARLLAKPGLTGWAQINFGYAATVGDTAVKLEYDLFYIKHRNIVMDITIMLRTVGQVFGLRGQ